jgi:spore germination cell wall hydrolase CwlJ-like protein
MLKFLKVSIPLIAIFILINLVVQGITYKFDQLRDQQNSMQYSTVTAEMRDQQLDCLAKNIYYEAGHEAFEGKAAVAQVTINRANSGRFPADICKVVYQKNVVYDRVLCQFSWYCTASGGLKPRNPAVYRECQEVAKKVLLEGFRLPSLKTAMYYHADYVSPGWNKRKIAQIGRHIFYAD